MPRQSAAVTKRFVTLFTFIWLFTDQCEDEDALSDALSTLIWFFTDLCEYGGAWSDDQAG